MGGLVTAFVLTAVAGVLALPCFADLAALLAGTWRRRRHVPGKGAELPRILFLVPAHDEELLLERCLRSVSRLRYPEHRWAALVVADNCRDRTAEVAQRAGVSCLVRDDPAHPGKPRALEWAFARIDLDAHDAVVVLDADSVVHPAYASALACRAPLRDRVVQGYNDVSNPAESHLTRMAAVFSAARALGMNEVKQRARLNSPLSNGFCIGADVLRRYGWPAFSLTEDWELYAILTAEGVTIENEPGARVFCQEAGTLRESGSQRRRWSAGKMAVAATRAPAILRSGRVGVLQKLDALAELLAPGPSVGLLTAAVVAGCALGIGVPGASWIAVGAALPIFRLGAYTLYALVQVNEPWRAASAFLVLPGYAVWRIGIQILALGTMARGRWVRTARHREA